MADTIILGYGGFGASCVREYSRRFSWPAAVVDSHEHENAPDELYLDYVELTFDEQLDLGKLRNLMDGYRNVLLVSSLGGESFGQAYQTIVQSARSLNLPITSLCTIPYIFESERRSRALENLATLSETADNLFLIDSQKTIRDDCAPGDFLENTKALLVNILKVLTGLLDGGPFHSYCSDSVYTFAIGSAPLVIDAVRNALDTPLFQLNSVSGKMLVCTSTDLDTNDVGDITSYLVRRCSALPEFLGKSDLGDQKVILFVPISFRQHE